MKKKISLFLVLALLICSSTVFSSGITQAASKKPKLNVKKLEMTLGSEFSLRVYNLKKKFSVSYVSNKPEIATVSNVAPNGKKADIFAQGLGSATITVTIRNKAQKIIRKQKCKLKISPSGVSIKFLKRKIEMVPGDRFFVNPIIKPNTSTERPVFESDNPQVALISSRGTITAIGSGVANITATLLSTGQTATCTVTVSNDTPFSSRKRMLDGNMVID